MTAAWILPVVLGVAVLLGWTRLLLWQRAAAPAERSRGWRLALLLLLQPIVAGLLYLTLMPPALPGRANGLVLLTRDAASAAAGGGGGRVVALPEARAGPEVERAPDLATALRRYPGTARLVVRGEGLELRDRLAAAGLPLAFAPAPPPAGLSRLSLPPPVAPGAAFQVAGAIEGRQAVAAELLDPAGRRIDAAPLSPTGTFALIGAARDPGAVLFTLRTLDAAGGVVEQAALPIRVVASPAPKLLLLAGAPNAEVKALRRWASDAGLSIHAQIGTGGGIALGDAPLALSAATLARFDVAVVDERSWAAAGAGGRAALLAAARDGLGLLLRVEGPLDPATRQQWRSLGFALGDAGGAVRLPREAIDEAALRARRGAGTRDVATALNLAQNDAPVLTRGATLSAALAVVPVVRDAAGAPLAGWRAFGRGRVGVWTVADSYALVLSGQRERHGELWSRTLAALARPAGGGEPTVDPFPRAGRRMTVCGFTGEGAIVDPAGGRAALLPDPAAGGCAGYWPTRAGWHLLRVGGGTMPIDVLAPDALPGLRAAETREATMRLVNDGARRTGGRIEAGGEFLAVVLGLAGGERVAMVAGAGASWTDRLKQSLFRRVPFVLSLSKHCSSPLREIRTALRQARDERIRGSRP